MTRHMFLMRAAMLGLVGSAVLAAQTATRPHTQPEASLPPDQTDAERRLAESPRHGEWVDVTMTRPAGGEPLKLKTWVVYPERSGKAPVVLVIHEIFGLSDWVRAVADQLAADGFIAVAPDFLSGMGPDGGGTSSIPAGELRERIRTLTAEDVAARLNAAREYAIKLPAATDKT